MLHYYGTIENVPVGCRTSGECLSFLAVNGSLFPDRRIYFPVEYVHTENEINMIAAKTIYASLISMDGGTYLLMDDIFDGFGRIIVRISEDLARGDLEKNALIFVNVNFQNRFRDRFDSLPCQNLESDKHQIIQWLYRQGFDISSTVRQGS